MSVYRIDADATTVPVSVGQDEIAGFRQVYGPRAADSNDVRAFDHAWWFPGGKRHKS
jgi:hypothetical protein